MSKIQVLYYNERFYKGVRLITDQEIVANVLAGDLEMFCHIIDRYQQPISKLIYFNLKNTNIVEDLTQETFIRAYKYLPKYNPHKSLKNWLLVIAKNQCNTWYHKQLITVPIKVLFNLTTNDDVSNQVITNQNFYEIKQLVQSLPSKERDVIILHYIQELSISEVGELLKIPVGTVKSRLNRGLIRLRKIAHPQLDWRNYYDP